jgi:TRAP-type C4-dicarboxylate transport system permease small subunit
VLARLRWLAGHAEEVAAGAVVIGLSGLAFANIVARYAISYALAFSEELEVAGLVWLTMLGAAIGFRRSAHIGFTIVRDLLPPLGRRGAALLTVAITLATVLVLGWYGVLEIRAERALGAVSEALGLPQWIYTAAIPVGAIIVAVRIVEAARREIREA